MRLGVHLSISGGLLGVVEEAKKRNCETVQIFIQSPRSWSASIFEAVEIASFKDGLKGEGIFPLVIHAPYLINLVSSRFSLRLKSALSVVEHLRMGRELGADFVVIHPGSNSLLGSLGSKDLLLESLDFVFSRTSEESPLLLLENMAQKGSSSQSFANLLKFINESGFSSRLGICLDTAHAFAAGYDLSLVSGWKKVLNELEENGGFSYLKLIHVNDSCYPAGSGRDRHADLGQGKIGKAGFSYLVDEPLFANLPCILETPKMSLADDLRNLSFIRNLRRRRNNSSRKAEQEV